MHDVVFFKAAQTFKQSEHDFSDLISSEYSIFLNKQTLTYFISS